MLKIQYKKDLPEMDWYGQFHADKVNIPETDPRLKKIALTLN